MMVAPGIGAPSVTGTPAESARLEQATSAPIVAFQLDTTGASVLHRLGRSAGGAAAGGPPPLGKAYGTAVAVTYLPLLVAALVSPLPLRTLAHPLKLPFLSDWNVAFMFLVSFPALVALTLSDQHVLATSLRRVQLDGIVFVADPTGTSLTGYWEQRFRWINVVAEILGVLLGCAVAVANFITYTPESVGFWIASHGRLLPVGYVFLYCIALFYTLIPIYVMRSGAIALLLRDLVMCARLRPLPLHPDKSGGLRPIGQLGLRNQYVLSIFGVNVVLLVVVSVINLDVSSSLYGLIAAAVIAYMLLGPIVFLGPLLPFRGGLRRTKSELMSEVAQRLRRELVRIRTLLLTSAPISREDEELIDRLRKIAAVRSTSYRCGRSTPDFFEDSWRPMSPR
jgi:hypothetical protein